MDTQCEKYGIVQGENDRVARFVGPNKDDIAFREDIWLQNIWDAQVSGPKFMYLIGGHCVLVC